MAVRGGPARRIPTDPLASVLKSQARAGRRPPPARGRTGPAGPPGERGPAGPPGRTGPQPRALTPEPPPYAAGVVCTDDAGRAVWDLPEGFTVAPVCTAVAVDPDPASDRTVLVVLEEVTAARAVVRVWRTRPKRGQGVADPAGSGVMVHLTAVQPHVSSGHRF